jgi:hypothetical protein
MKRSLKTGYIVLVFLLLLAGLASTTHAAPMTCSFVGGSSGAISFGNIDPMNASPIIGNVVTPVQFTCGQWKAYTITVNPASGWQLSSGSNTISYTLGVAPSGTYGGAAVDVFTASGSIIMTQAQYGGAPAGSYSNTSAINVTISWSGGQAGSIVATLPATTGVTANIIDTCGTAVSGSMSFNIDPSVAGPITANTTANGTDPSVKCTKNATHAVACSALHSNLSIGNDGATDLIAYTITGCATPLTGQGFSTVTSIPVGISIAQTAYQNAQAGAHSDTITVTVTY